MPETISSNAVTSEAVSLATQNGASGSPGWLPTPALARSWRWSAATSVPTLITNVRMPVSNAAVTASVAMPRESVSMSPISASGNSQVSGSPSVARTRTLSPSHVSSVNVWVATTRDSPVGVSPAGCVLPSSVVISSAASSCGASVVTSGHMPPFIVGFRYSETPKRISDCSWVTTPPLPTSEDSTASQRVAVASKSSSMLPLPSTTSWIVGTVGKRISCSCGHLSPPPLAVIAVGSVPLSSTLSVAVIVALAPLVGAVSVPGPSVPSVSAGQPPCASPSSWHGGAQPTSPAAPVVAIIEINQSLIEVPRPHRGLSRWRENGSTVARGGRGDRRSPLRTM